LTESEEQTVTEIGCECSEIRNCYHLRRRRRWFTAAVKDRRFELESGWFEGGVSLFLSLEERDDEDFRERK